MRILTLKQTQQCMYMKVK